MESEGKKLSRLLQHLRDASAAVILVLPLWLAWTAWQDIHIRYMETKAELATVYRETAPASDFFEVSDVRIPDHAEGDDPLVLYLRDIHRDFTGDWFITLFPEDRPTRIACDGAGRFRYRSNVELSDNQMPLSRFIGKQCGLPAGCYFGLARWEIRPDGFPMKELEKRIPEFCVSYKQPEAQ